MSESSSAQRRVPVVGVTGAACSGKSTVARMMADEGFAVIDVDRVGHEALERDDVKTVLRREFGDGIFDEKGAVNRKTLGGMVFGCRESLAKLNAIVHPPMIREVEKQIGRADRPVVLDAALLIEMGMDDRLCDMVVFVEAPDEQRRARALRGPGWDVEELARRDRAQMPPDAKRRRADLIISNSGSEEELRDLVKKSAERIWKEIVRSPRQAVRPQ